MPRAKAPVKATGGGGYTFADKVAASFLAQMLSRKFPFGTDLGSIIGVHFETRDVGNILDDLELTLRRGDCDTRCFVSIKSNRQLTKKGFSSELVKDVWDQWHLRIVSGFDPGKDILAIVVGAADELTFKAWQEIQRQAGSTTPDRLSARLQDTEQSSAIHRALFTSLRKSPEGEATEHETARLASRLKIHRFSEDQEGEYVNLCSEISSDGTVESGVKLWGRLLQMVGEYRATGGFVDLGKLISILRPDFELRDYPDFGNDWSKVEAVTKDNITAVRRVLGREGIELPRLDAKKHLQDAVEAHNAVLVLGESGSGKSALVSQLVGTHDQFKRVVWLTAEQLSKSSQAELANAFGLKHRIRDMIAHSGNHGCILVVDGFERFEGNALRRAIELVSAVSEEGFVGWKVIVTGQPQSERYILDALVEGGVTDAHAVDFEKPELKEIFLAVGGLPSIGTLLVRPDVQPILRNLMVLDWVLRGDVAQRFSPTRPSIGTTEIIDSIWERWVGSGTASLARDALLRTLGQREGERLSGAIHVDNIPPAELPLLGAFRQEGLVRVDPPSVQFAHDLMGDWARYRVLKFAGDQAAHAIKTLAPVPRWSRAIRLYSQFLAEHGEGLRDWRDMSLKLLGDDADSKLASDLFLDGLLFAANSQLLLEQVWTDLIADDGQILNRLLKRLVSVASVPDWRVDGFGDPKLAEKSKVWFRIPLPLYWAPLLYVLARHSNDVAKKALIPAADVCALWLRTMPAAIPGRREAATVALDLAREAQGLIAEGAFFDAKDKVIYEALLSAAHRNSPLR